MSSDLVPILKVIETYDYTPVIIITIVGYDYILTFSREFDAVWCRPWTWVSTLFIIIRYLGLCWAVALSLTGTTFVSGSVNVSTTIMEIGDWGYIAFLAAADLVMILRVNAMWNQSRMILRILLLIYVAQMIVTVAWEVIYVNPSKSLSVTTSRVFDFTACGYLTSTTPSATYRAVPRFVLGVVMMVFAVIPATAQAFEMYKVGRRWQTNPTMRLLVNEAAAYFIVNLLFNIVNAIELPSIDWMLFLDTLGYSLSCAIMPRFIISIRELYDRDLRERWQGIDTGFSRCTDLFPNRSEGGSTALTDSIPEGRGADHSGAIELEDVRDERGV